MYGPVTRMRLKNETKRGLKKSRCPLLKFLNFLREMRSFSQSSSDSQGRLWAREKSILKIVYLRLLVPNVIV
jgi:hypothetical protein